VLTTLPAGATVLNEVTRNDQPTPEQDPASVPACEWRTARQRHVGGGFGKACGVDDFSFQKISVALTGDRLDDEADEAIAVDGVFEPRAGVDHRWLVEVRLQLARVEERTPVEKLSGVMPISHKTRAVGAKLRDRSACNAGMQITDELPRRIVELKLALLAELQDAGGGEAFRGARRCGPEFADQYGRAKGFLDRILKGEKPRPDSSRSDRYSCNR
jgi:hypothetical protein